MPFPQIKVITYHGNDLEFKGLKHAIDYNSVQSYVADTGHSSLSIMLPNTEKYRIMQENFEGRLKKYYEENNIPSGVRANLFKTRKMTKSEKEDYKNNLLGKESKVFREIYSKIENEEISENDIEEKMRDKLEQFRNKININEVIECHFSFWPPPDLEEVEIDVDIPDSEKEEKRLERYNEYEKLGYETVEQRADLIFERQGQHVVYRESYKKYFSDIIETRVHKGNVYDYAPISIVREAGLNEEDKKLLNDFVKFHTHQNNVTTLSFLALKFKDIKDPAKLRISKNTKFALKRLVPGYEKKYDLSTEAGIKKLYNFLNNESMVLQKLYIEPYQKFLKDNPDKLNRISELERDFITYGGEPDGVEELPIKDPKGEQDGLNVNAMFNQMYKELTDGRGFQIINKNCSTTVSNVVLAGLKGMKNQEHLEDIWNTNSNFAGIIFTPSSVNGAAIAIAKSIRDNKVLPTYKEIFSFGGKFTFIQKVAAFIKKIGIYSAEYNYVKALNLSVTAMEPGNELSKFTALDEASYVGLDDDLKKFMGENGICDNEGKILDKFRNEKGIVDKKLIDKKATDAQKEQFKNYNKLRGKMRTRFKWKNIGTIVLVAPVALGIFTLQRILNPVKSFKEITGIMGYLWGIKKPVVAGLAKVVAISLAVPGALAGVSAIIQTPFRLAFKGVGTFITKSSQPRVKEKSRKLNILAVENKYRKKAKIKTVVDLQQEIRNTVAKNCKDIEIAKPAGKDKFILLPSSRGQSAKQSNLAVDEILTKFYQELESNPDAVVKLNKHAEKIILKAISKDYTIKDDTLIDFINSDVNIPQNLKTSLKAIYNSLTERSYKNYIKRDARLEMEAIRMIDINKYIKDIDNEMKKLKKKVIKQRELTEDPKKLTLINQAFNIKKAYLQKERAKLIKFRRKASISVAKQLQKKRFTMRGELGKQHLPVKITKFQKKRKNKPGKR